MTLQMQKNNQSLNCEEIAALQGGQVYNMSQVHEYHNGSWRLVWEKLKRITINGGTDVNLATFLANNGITSGKVEITNIGTIKASSTGTPACVTGELSGYKDVMFINQGTVVGKGGSGGYGGTAAGQGGNGGAGGTAFYASSLVHVQNDGAIYAGGGGGGGGGAFSHRYCSESDSGKCRRYVTVRRDGGIGGRGYGTDGNATGGSGGSSCVWGSSGGGGKGGNSGASGSNGARGAKSKINGGYGGAGGKSISGNDKIVWQKTGTRTGAVT